MEKTERLKFRYTKHILEHWRTCRYTHIGNSGNMPFEVLPIPLRVYGGSIRAIACLSYVGYVLRPGDDRLSLTPHVDLWPFTRVPFTKSELQEGAYSFARGETDLQNAYIVRIVRDQESALLEALLHLSYCKRVERPLNFVTDLRIDCLRIDCPAYSILAYARSAVYEPGKYVLCARTERIHAPLYSVLRVMGFDYIELVYSRIGVLCDVWERLYSGFRLPSCG